MFFLLLLFLFLQMFLQYNLSLFDFVFPLIDACKHYFPMLCPFIS